MTQGVLEFTVAIVGVTVAFATILIGMLQLLERKRTRYDLQKHRIELSAMRQSFEHQMLSLTERLMATEARWRDANHLLLSSQAHQTEAASEQRVPLTPFLTAAGINESDVAVDRSLVFVLTPFSSEYAGSFRAIAETCRDLGLKAVRGDEDFIRGEVFPSILRQILKARLLIANIEGRNPNVLYELGLAHAMGKTTILVARAPGDVPFDIRAKKLVLYKSEAELKEKLRLELARALAA